VLSPASDACFLAIRVQVSSYLGDLSRFWEAS
jgi:hypothetical protein